jgi:hypothetical protein
MIISVAISKSVLRAIRPEDLPSIKALRQMLRDVCVNGIMLDSKREELFAELRACEHRLPAKHQKTIQTCVEEMKKNKKRYIATCRDGRCDREGSCDSLADISCLAAALKADAVVADSDEVTKAKSDGQTGSEKTEFVALEDYGDSETERSRQEYQTPSSTFAELPMIDRRRLLGKALKYTRWVRLYDAYIGRTPENAESVGRTISEMVESVKQFGLSQEIPALELCTSAEERDEASEVRANIAKALRQQVLHDQLDVGVRIMPSTKFRELHNRYMQTESRLFLVEPGFDFFDRGGLRKNIVIKIVDETRSEVERYWKLPPIVGFDFKISMG